MFNNDYELAILICLFFGLTLFQIIIFAQYSQDDIEVCPISIPFIEILKVHTPFIPLCGTKSDNIEQRDVRNTNFNYELKLNIKIEGTKNWNEPVAIKIKTPDENICYECFNLGCFELQPNIFYDFALKFTTMKKGIVFKV